MGHTAVTRRLQVGKWAKDAVGQRREWVVSGTVLPRPCFASGGDTGFGGGSGCHGGGSIFQIAARLLLQA